MYSFIMNIPHLSYMVLLLCHFSQIINHLIAIIEVNVFFKQSFTFC